MAEVIEGEVVSCVDTPVETTEVVVAQEVKPVAIPRGMAAYHGKAVRVDRMAKLFQEYGEQGLDKKAISKRIGHNAGAMMRRLPELLEAWKKGFDTNQIEVEGALLKRALGSRETEKRVERVLDKDGNVISTIEREADIPVLPDVQAMKLLLKARGGKRWEENADVQVGVQVIIQKEDVDL